MSTTKKYAIKVWDISIRIFHWSLVAGIGFLWFSGEEGGNIMTWHVYIGCAMLGLIVYRIFWGIIGSPYARFSEFFKRPSHTFTYLKNILKGEKTDYLGHNPLGGWMVIILMILIFTQAFSGLFSSDDIFTEGPFYSLISSKTSELFTSIHHLNFNVLLAAIALHIGAVAYHVLIKKEALIKSMLTGEKQSPRPSRINTRPNYFFMLLSASVAATVVYLLISQA
ncbi:cytochrome b/b6 domain-containing protein [Neptunomonas japonica]|uniref:cytochrome b/b6 domain-containing protein n=1 Tax=Neptunomonas japonica TaxID=417574 RepID=UPI00048ADFC8|nr:cytochrome b/b6 domain-containing protein [Neptunomonas japonica]